MHVRVTFYFKHILVIIWGISLYFSENKSVTWKLLPVSSEMDKNFETH